MKQIDLESKNSKDYIRVALALETLRYHNKNYLAKPFQNECTLSEEMQGLLIKALEVTENE